MTALKKINKGFTLIELLIVMAILGVLAVIVLVAINPAEQMARARDTGRISGVQQVGRAIAAYYTGNGALPTVGTGWDGELTGAQELQTMPAGIPYSYNSVTACGTNVVENTWCYDGNDATGNFVVFATLESEQREAQCTAAGGGAPIAVFSSIAARGGIVCATPDPDVAPTFL